MAATLSSFCRPKLRLSRRTLLRQIKKDWALLDTFTASQWNFQGCAISGPAQGKCLDRVSALKDYWFDWRNYHPETTVYKH